MKKVRKVVLSAILFGLTLGFVGCGGGGGDDTVALVGGLWDIVIDVQTGTATITQNDRNLVITVDDGTVMNGEVNGSSVEFEVIQTFPENHVYVNAITLTINDVDNPTIMTGEWWSSYDNIDTYRVPAVFTRP